MGKWGHSNIVIEEEDLKNYFQYVENLGKLPKGKFHIVMKDLLLICLEKEQYKMMYPNACEILRIYYLFSKVDKFNQLESFLYFVNEEGAIPNKDSKIVFVDGASVFRYWKNNKEMIYETILDETSKNDYKIKYPIAYAIIKDRYDKNKRLNKSEKNEKIIVSKPKRSSNRYSGARGLDFIEYVEEYALKYDKMPSTPYFDSNRELIMGIFNDTNYQLSYPNAYRVLLNYTQYKKLTFEEKTIEIINYIDKKQRNIEREDKVKFSNGDGMFYFWCTKRKEIIQYFKNNLNSTDYPNFNRVVIHYTALKMIKDDFNVDKFFINVDTFRIIGANKLNSKITLLDYWYEYKEILNYIALNFNYDSKYPNACEIIRQKYNEEFQEERKRSFKL